MEQKRLTSSVYTFENLIDGGYLYVDKTEQLWQMLEPPSGIYFLSRPRRFGKSLTISTLKAAFQGKKKLFDGLALAAKPFTWKPYPIIHLDLGNSAAADASQLETYLVETLDALAADQDLKLSRSGSAGRFTELVSALGRRDKVVILIDEYDKPLIDNLDNPKLKDIRSVLEGFYSVVKATEPFQRFVLLTGVSKFSQVSVFSKLNNLYDISMDERFATMLGYTQGELEANFADRIETAAQRHGVAKAELLERLREWYNGYRFHPERASVYNPVSVAKFFESGGEFENYWFATGTPSFLLKLLKRQRFDFEKALGQPVDRLAFAAYDVERIEALPLLFQTGYLTIKSSSLSRGVTRYRLGFPNREVEAAFNAYLLEEYGAVKKERSGVIASDLADFLESGDLKGAMELLRTFLADIPYDIHIKAERYYQTIFYTFFRLVGIFVEAEARTSSGRIDAVVKAGTHIYIFEFKLDGSADTALEQIRDKEYWLKHRAEGKDITLVGASFGAAERNLVEWKTTSPPEAG